MNVEEGLIEVEDVVQIIGVDKVEDSYLGEVEIIQFMVDFHTTIFTEEEPLVIIIIKAGEIKIIVVIWEEILIE
jgi:hypothetical protein